MTDAPGNVFELIDAFMAEYNRGAFGRALKLLEREAPRHPQYHALVLFWQACMAARAGDPEKALARLRDGVTAGYWYHEAALRGDPDLESLQGDPRLGEIVRVCAGRRARARELALPDRLVLEPVGHPRPWPVLLALHGNMSNMELFAPYWQRAVDLGWLVVAPQSTQMYWASGFYTWDDTQRAVAELQEHYLAVCRQYEFDPRQVVVAGFSSGGAVAARAALSGAIPAGGFLMLEGYSTAHERELEWKSLVSRASPRLRVCIQCGQVGAEMVEGARNLRDMLAWRGISARLYETQNTVHAMPPGFDALLEEMLAFQGR